MVVQSEKRIEKRTAAKGVLNMCRRLSDAVVYYNTIISGWMWEAVGNVVRLNYDCRMNLFMHIPRVVIVYTCLLFVC